MKTGTIWEGFSFFFQLFFFSIPSFSIVSFFIKNPHCFQALSGEQSTQSANLTLVLFWAGIPSLHLSHSHIISILFPSHLLSLSLPFPFPLTPFPFPSHPLSLSLSPPFPFPLTPFPLTSILLPSFPLKLHVQLTLPCASNQSMRRKWMI